MSALAEPVVDVPSDDRLARRNALVLAVTQALAGGNQTVLVATAGIVGTVLAPDKGLATLPLSVLVLGMWMGTVPVGCAGAALRPAHRPADRHGRGRTGRADLLRGGAAGLVPAFQHRRRRSAASMRPPTSPTVSPPTDTASDAFRPKAISWVLLGGVVGAVVGPQLVIATQDLWPPYLFAASYLGQAALALISAGVLMFVNIPRPPPRSAVGDGRPLAEIARQPRFIVAVACGVAAYSMMNMLMTSAPLAMVMCNHSITDATLGLQWHVLGMYLPSFFTGSLIVRFGVTRIVLLGLALLLRQRGDRHRGHHALAFLDRVRAARRRLEFRLHRRDHHGDRVLPTERAQQGAGVQRFPRSSARWRSARSHPASCW